jgi:hypothetical protein
MSVRFSVHTTPFCNQLLVGETITVKENLQPAARIVMKTLMPLVALHFLHCRFTMFFQHSQLAKCCSVAAVSKCE